MTHAFLHCLFEKCLLGYLMIENITLQMKFSMVTYLNMWTHSARVHIFENVQKRSAQLIVFRKKLNRKLLNLSKNYRFIQNLMISCAEMSSLLIHFCKISSGK